MSNETVIYIFRSESYRRRWDFDYAPPICKDCREAIASQAWIEKYDAAVRNYQAAQRELADLYRKTETGKGVGDGK